MPTCECCRKHWLVDCPNCGHSMLGYTAEYDADVIAAERARIRAAVEELTGYDIEFGREAIEMPDLGDTKRYVGSRDPIAMTVSTVGYGRLIERAAVLAIIDADA